MQIRSNALLEAGGSPTWTLTEDFALGMELKKYGWHCRYVQEYLAIGEAPDQIRNCFQQRSRWCKVNVLIYIYQSMQIALTCLLYDGSTKRLQSCVNSFQGPEASSAVVIIVDATVTDK